MKIEGVLWDMDGVLVDTAELHYQSWHDALLGRGVDFSREIFAATFGKNNEETMRMLLGETANKREAEQIAGEKEAAFRKSIRGGIKLMPGVIRWLNNFQAKSILQAVASSAPMANIEVIIDECRIGQYFRTVNSGTGMLSKPHPDIFLAAAQSIDVQPQNCLVIEDSRMGVEAAKNASMYCVAVSMSSLADDLSAADVVVDSLEALSESDLDNI
jgi:beta-phosphoglucomutase family hydrolase